MGGGKISGTKRGLGGEKGGLKSRLRGEGPKRERGRHKKAFLRRAVFLGFGPGDLHVTGEPMVRI